MAKCAAVSLGGAQLIPVQTVAIEKLYDRSDDGQKLGSRFNITIEGTLVDHKGSPRSSGDPAASDPNWGGPNSAFWVGADTAPDEDRTTLVSFNALLDKQEHMRALCATDGQLLEIQSSDASPPIKGAVRINSLQFAPGNWIETSPYTIQCEADILVGQINTGDGEDDFEYYVTSASESWNLEFNQPENADQQYTYRFTHTITAKGKTHWDFDGTIPIPAWQSAKNFCVARLGYDASMAAGSGVLDLQNYTPRNHLRMESPDELGGNYSITESWILATGAATEDFTVTSNTSITDPIRRVSIEGSIQGLDYVNYTSTGILLLESKWQAASGYFAQISGLLYERAYTYSQANQFPRALNMIPATTQINRNPVAGTINYSYQFDTRRPLCLSHNPNILSENITITDNGLTNTIAIISVLGRAAGDILQNTRTFSHRKRLMSVDLIVLPPTGCMLSALKVGNIMSQSPESDVRQLFLAMDFYLAGLYPSCYVTQNTASWSNDLSAYNKTVEWTLGNCDGAGSSGII